MSKKSDVEIKISLQFKNQYSGDGQTEPTREQVREALIDFANSNLNYTEIRTAIDAEKGEENDAWNVHNDIVTGIYEQHDMNANITVDNNRTLSKNAYLLNEEPVNTPLETFNDMDDALELAYSIQRKADTESRNAKSLGRDSKEQGGNRSRNQYNTDRDPLNED